MRLPQETAKFAIRGPSFSLGFPVLSASLSKDTASFLCAFSYNPESLTGDKDLNVQSFSIRGFVFLCPS